MDPRKRERGEHPYLPVVYKKMWPGAPVHRVAIVSFQVEDVLLRESIRPLCQCRRCSVMQDDERRAPRRPPQRMTVAVKIIRGVGISNDSFPVWHRSPLVL